MATYERTCEQCGDGFSAGRRHARFCSDTCRSRKHRGKPATQLTVVGGSVVKTARTAKAPAKQTGGAEPNAGSAAPPAPTYDTLEEQVRQDLADVSALSTISGMAAVRIAQQIDRGGDSGSAVATLSKELSRLVGEAKVEAAPKTKDAVDDLAARVNAKILKLVQ